MGCTLYSNCAAPDCLPQFMKPQPSSWPGASVWVVVVTGLLWMALSPSRAQAIVSAVTGVHASLLRPSIIRPVGILLLAAIALGIWFNSKHLW